MLQIWLLSHLCVRKERVKQNFFLKISPLSMALEEECHQDKTEKHWVQELRNVKEEEITWRAPWVFPQSIVHKYGDYTCVPLLGLWEIPVILLYWYCIISSASNSSRSSKTWDIGILNLESLIIKRKSSQLSKPGRKSIVWKDIGEEALPLLDMKSGGSAVSMIHCHYPTPRHCKSQ